MKIVNRFAYGLGLAALCFGAGIASAQDVQTVSVKFPFAVTVGSKTLPAGQYTISPLDNSGEAPIFLVRGSNGSAVAFAAARFNTPKHPLLKDDVVIEVTGDKHILSQVRLQASDSVFELIRPSVK